MFGQNGRMSKSGAAASSLPVWKYFEPIKFLVERTLLPFLTLLLSNLRLQKGLKLTSCFVWCYSKAIVNKQPDIRIEWRGKWRFPFLEESCTNYFITPSTLKNVWWKYNNFCLTLSLRNNYKLNKLKYLQVYVIKYYIYQSSLFSTK